MTIDIRKDLRWLFGQARNQKRRPTCMAFASSDVHAAVRGLPFEELSTEYAHFHASQRCAVFSPDRGVSMANMINAIRDDGQPHESGWAYMDQLPSKIADYVPPAQVGIIFRRNGRIEQSLDIVVNCLEQDQPVVMAMEISSEFYAPQTGEPVRAAIDSPIIGRHAVAAVGYGIASGEQVFLVRNSWGTAWGDQGYAWLSRHYVQPRLMSIGVYEK